MSLVGPRPIVVDEAEIVGLDSRRFEAKPGITGLAQVRGRDSIGMTDRTELDIVYVDERTIKLDIEILFATVGTIFAEPGATGFEQSSEE
jgi:lipopolysaccharide/colanic/teichoic acid biosynthesis glycosyltransferase